MIRSSQRGNHQFARPTSTITAGTSRQRTTRRVDRDGDAHADAELLDRRVAVDDEGEEDADHDQRGRGDHAAGGADAA